MHLSLPRIPTALIALLMGSASFAATADAHAATKTVKVTLGKPTEYSVTPSVTSVKAGKVTFVVTNKGTITHELNVIGVSRATATLPKGTAAGQVREKGKIAAVEGLKAGKSSTVSTRLTPGTYQLFCNIPGHYAAGMRVSITVT